MFFVDDETSNKWSFECLPITKLKGKKLLMS